MCLCYARFSVVIMLKRDRLCSATKEQHYTQFGAREGESNAILADTRGFNAIVGPGGEARGPRAPRLSRLLPRPPCPRMPPKPHAGAHALSEKRKKRREEIPLPDNVKHEPNPPWKDPRRRRGRQASLKSCEGRKVVFGAARGAATTLREANFREFSLRAAGWGLGSGMWREGGAQRLCLVHRIRKVQLGINVMTRARNAHPL